MAAVREVRWRVLRWLNWCRKGDLASIDSEFGASAAKGMHVSVFITILRLMAQSTGRGVQFRKSSDRWTDPGKFGLRFSSDTSPTMTSKESVP